jgi:hypothetical protein
MTSFRPLAMLLGVVLVASCDTGSKGMMNISAPAAGSAVKFFNFGVGAPTVNFYANDQKVTAASTTSCSDLVTGATSDTACLNGGKEATTGTGYGGAANGATGLYSSITPGGVTLSGRITTTVNNGVAISNTAATLADGKFYSYFLSGIYNSTTKTVEAFIVEDPMPVADYVNANVRFVNAISNAQPMTLYAKEQTSGVETAIGSSVAYKNAGAFVTLPPGIYDLSTRVAGSATNVITRTTVSFNAARVYTVTAYGDITASTGTNKPALDNTANR